MCTKCVVLLATTAWLQCIPPLHTPHCIPHSGFTKAVPWTASSPADVADGRDCASRHDSSIPTLPHGRNSHVLDGQSFQVQITMASGCCEGLVPVLYIPARIPAYELAGPSIRMQLTTMPEAHSGLVRESTTRYKGCILACSFGSCTQRYTYIGFRVEIK